MNNIIEYLIDKNIILKSLEEIDKSILKTRKKLNIFTGTDLNDYYNLIFIIEQKSRFLQKNSGEIMELSKRIENIVNHNYKYKIIFIKSPICSKAYALLKENGWRVYK